MTRIKLKNIKLYYLYTSPQLQPRFDLSLKSILEIRVQNTVLLSVLSILYVGKTATDLLNFESMKYHDGKVVFTYKSKKFTVLNEISCDPKVETIYAVGKTEISAGYNILWTSKLVCPPVTGEECSITHERDLYDLSVLAKEEWNWLARNNIKEFGFKDYQFHFSVCKPLKNIARLTNSGSRGAMENKISGLVKNIEILMVDVSWLAKKLKQTFQQIVYKLENIFPINLVWTKTTGQILSQG